MGNTVPAGFRFQDKRVPPLCCERLVPSPDRPNEFKRQPISHPESVRLLALLDALVAGQRYRHVTGFYTRGANQGRTIGSALLTVRSRACPDVYLIRNSAVPDLSIEPNAGILADRLVQYFLNGDRCGTPRPPPPAAAAPPSPSPSPRPTRVTPPQFCLNCHQRGVEVRLHPCEHVAMCPGCFEALRSSPLLRCPECRRTGRPGRVVGASMNPGATVRFAIPLPPRASEEEEQGGGIVKGAAVCI